MRASQYLLRTSREDPAAAETASHRLMMRAGMVRALASGLYTWLPLGLRTLHKVAQIVREEMDRTGALEVRMPMVQPAELWRESGRWSEYGPELLRFKDRHQRDFCLGPTHEEVITALVRDELSSYRALPLNLYQIQTKFRDEVRPRFGIMRAREFVMKDAYSFHADAGCLQRGYEKMRDAYHRIFRRLGLQFRMVAADSGSIGGSLSHEFHALADAGEDVIVFSDSSDYASNLELAQAGEVQQTAPAAARAPMQEVETFDAAGIEEVCKLLKLHPEQTVKTLVVEGGDGLPAALVLRGDHTLNELKATRLPQVRAPLQFVAAERVQELLGAPPGAIGPVGLKGAQLIVDRAAAGLSGFVCGANVRGRHYTGVHWGRDCEAEQVADLRNVCAGDPSPDGRGRLQVRRGIEVGHIFQLGQKYSAALGAVVDAEDGSRQTLYMGCYGIGIGRSVAAIIEQNHDAAGIIWPPPVAPFQLVLSALNIEANAEVRRTAEDLYRRCTEQGLEVLYDDRDERAGVKLADAELLGIPHRLTVGARGLRGADKTVEYRERRAQHSEKLPLEAALEILTERLRHAHADS